MPVIALLNIWLLIFLNAAIAKIMYKADKFSGIIYIPYVLWLLFASYLNLFIVMNN
jgi:tryptophan-rich sensory protein